MEDKSMTSSLATLLLAGGLALTAPPGYAADPGPGPEHQQMVQTQKERLASRSQELLRRLQRPTPVRASAGPAASQVAQKNEIRRQRREIEALIKRLEAGEKVAPGEVEQLIEAR